MRAQRGGLLTLAAAASLIAAGSPAAAQGAPPALVVLDPVREELLQDRRRVSGELRAIRRSLLAARVEGLVVELPVAEGQSLALDAVVARLDDRYAKLDVAYAKAVLSAQGGLVAQREAELAQAKLDLARVQSLLQRSAASQSDLDAARTEVEAASARLDQARADGQAAEVQLARAAARRDDLTIKAPFAGSVLEKRTEVGQWLKIGDPVLEVVDLREVEAWLQVPERWIGGLRAPKATVLVEVSALAESLEAEVTQVLDAADPLSRLFPVRIALPNPGGALRPGMSITGLVPTGAQSLLLTVSKDAVLRDAAGAFVYASIEGVARPVRIDPLFATGDRMAVRRGALRASTPVVVEGNERLFPGQPLRTGAPAAKER